MKTAGIICEYNPFHNAHRLHVEKTREGTGCEWVIAAMSGAFTQRGDPAIADKWTRTRMALKNGVDIVIELPAAFCVRTADKFALGGVSVLAAAGCEWLSFGCEAGGAEFIERAAKETADESEGFSRAVKDGLSRGKSHARARGEALAGILGVEAGRLNMPNTALAIEYARANSRLERPMKLFPVKRQGDYNDLRLSEICSASAIRKAVREGLDCSCAMPESAHALLIKSFPDGLSREGALDELTLYALRNARPEQLALLPDAGEGAYMLLKKRAEKAGSRKDLLESAKCKRYTMARLNRMATYAVLNINLERLNGIESPPYLRVLGFRRSASALLRRVCELSPIPVATDPVKLKGDDCFNIENMYTDLWALTVKNPAARAAGQDYTRQIVIEE